MSEIFLPPVEQLINVDLFNSLQESDVGQFGPDYTNLERYKQAGEYALEAQMYAQMAEDYGNLTYKKIKNLLESSGDASTLVALSLETGASKIGTFSGKNVQEELNQVVKYINPMNYGAKGDGISFDDIAFSSMISDIVSTPGYFVIDGAMRTYKLSSTLPIDSGKYCIQNMALDFSGVVIPNNQPFYALTFNSTYSGTQELSRFTNINKNIELIGIGYRTSQKIYAMKFAPTNSLNSLYLDNFYIKDFNAGCVFGSNAYLLTFNNIRIHRCFHGIISTIETGEETSLHNCGENIRFNNCVFDSLHKVCYLSKGGWEIRFNDTSFDYTGRSLAEAYVQFFLGDGGCLFNFYNCHFESGNKNAGWFNYGFHTNGASTVSIEGGTIRLAATVNSCPYFFYDESNDATFRIVGTDINGWGVQKWCNHGLSEFRPLLKFPTNNFTLQTTEDSIVTNSKFVNGLDVQAVTLDTGTYTSRWVNDRLSITTSSITKSDGTVIPTLLIKKLTGVNTFAAIDVFMKRPVKAPHNSSIHGNMLFVPSTSMTSDRTITAVTGSCTKGFINNMGVVTSMRTITTTSNPVVLSASDTNWREINTSWACSHSNAYLEFEYDRIRLDLSGLALNDSLHLFNIAWYGAF